RPSVGAEISATATNLFTFLGAACFFIGALLQLQEIAKENARENKDNPDSTSILPQHLSNVVEGQN
ncbi:MAG TPA: hypothetical protein VIY29_16925, partial [Ktedonobacteraceae bacterium]